MRAVNGKDIHVDSYTRNRDLLQHVPEASAKSAFDILSGQYAAAPSISYPPGHSKYSAESLSEKASAKEAQDLEEKIRALVERAKNL